MNEDELTMKVRYAAHQLNLWPRASLSETSPTLCWTGKVGDASVFRVWGSRAFVRDSSVERLYARAIPYVFLGFPPDAPIWQFYHPTSCRVFPSEDVIFYESVPFYRLFPYRSAPPPPPPLFLAPSPPPVDPLPPQGPAPSGVSQVDPLLEPGGAESEGTGSGGAEPGVAEPRGAEPARVEPGGAELEGVEPWGGESGGAEPRGATSYGATAAAGPGGSRTRGTGAAWTGDVGGAGAGDPTEPGAAGAGGTGAGGTGAGGAGAGGAGAGGTGAGGAGDGGAGAGGSGAGGDGAGGAGAVDPRDGGAGARGAGGTGAGGTVRPRPYFVPLLQQVLGVPSNTSLTPPLLCPPPDQSKPPLQPASPLPAPSPYTEQSGGLTERRDHASRPFLPFRTFRRVPRSRPPPVPGTHAMALRPSSNPMRPPLPPPPESSIPSILDPESDLVHAASPTVSRLLSTVVTDLSSESTTASALVDELLDFAAACRLDYATALVAESESASPPSVGGESALGTDVLEDRQEDFECLAAAVPRSTSMLLAPEGAAMDAKMTSWKSTGTYVDAVPPSPANIVDGVWIFRVKRPPGSPPTFKARYIARGFSQRQGVDYFLTFSPTPKMTTLRVLLHVAAQRDYELHSLDFSTAFLQGSLHEEIWLRRPPRFTGSFPAGT
ncbi:unnamed protein product [Closterium sp. NIES-54]